MNSTLSRFQPLLRCTECSAHTLAWSAGTMTCDSCGYRYAINSGIPDLRPSKALRLPKVYEDPDYRRWNENLASAQDYFYESKGIISYVQNAGHRAVRNLCMGRDFAVTLDLGCGDGAHYRYLSSPERTLGIDIHQGSLEKLRRRYPDFAALRADAYNLPLRDGCIDCVINIYNLEHMAYLDLVLEEIYRVLLPDGHFFVSVPNEGGLAWTLGRRITTARQFNSATLNYERVIEIDHINCIWQVEKALKRYFHTVKRVLFPFRLPSFQANLITTYHLSKRMERLVHSVA